MGRQEVRREADSILPTADISLRLESGQNTLGFAQVFCTYKEGKYFEISLNANRMGEFYRIKVNCCADIINVP